MADKADKRKLADSFGKDVSEELNAWASYTRAVAIAQGVWDANSSLAQLSQYTKDLRSIAELTQGRYARAMKHTRGKLKSHWAKGSVASCRLVVDIADTDSESGVEDELVAAFQRALVDHKKKVVGKSKAFSELSGSAIDAYATAKSKFHRMKPRGRREAPEKFRTLIEFVQELYLAESAVHIQKDRKCASELSFTNLLRAALERSGLCRAIKVNNSEIANIDTIGAAKDQFSPSHGKPGDLCLAFQGDVFRMIIEVKTTLSQRSYFAEALAEARALSLAMKKQPMVVLLSPFRMTKIHYHLSSGQFSFEDVSKKHFIDELYTLLVEYHERPADEKDEEDEKGTGDAFDADTYVDDSTAEDDSDDDGSGSGSGEKDDHGSGSSSGKKDDDGGSSSSGSSSGGSSSSGSSSSGSSSSGSSSSGSSCGGSSVEKSASGGASDDVGKRSVANQKTAFIDTQICKDDVELMDGAVYNERKAARQRRRQKLAKTEQSTYARFRIVASSPAEVEELLKDDLQLAFLQAVGLTAGMELPVLYAK